MLSIVGSGLKGCLIVEGNIHEIFSEGGLVMKVAIENCFKELDFFWRIRYVNDCKRNNIQFRS